MPGLLDVAASTKTVPVGSGHVTVPGVSARGIAVLLERFPVVRELFTGKSPSLTADAIIKIVPDAIAAIIAAGCGSPGDPEAEKVADALPAETQAELLEAIMEVTMPKGAGPFVERLMGMARVMDGVPTNIPDMKSPKPSKP